MARHKDSCCPECGETERIYRDGLRYPHSNNGKPTQRYICRSCGYRFSEPKEEIHISRQAGTLHSRSNLAEPSIGKRNLSLKKPLNDPAFSLSEDVGSHTVTVVGKRLNNLRSYSCKRRVCETDGVSKNLSQQRTRQKRAAGATKTDKAEVKGRLVEHAFWLKKNGYAESTITKRIYVLKSLVKRGANLLDPESVKEAIANHKCSENTKASTVYAYDTFLRMLQIKWQPPRYKQTRKLPFIPTETEIDQLIAGTGKKTATLLQLLKQTGMRTGEALRLNWTDVDTKWNTITLNCPEKRGNARIFKVSRELIAMLSRLPKKSDRVFGNVLQRSVANTFRSQRRKMAAKLGNPRILRISFHTFRHWKATMEYHKTKDILHVKELLGHKRIDNTLIYTHLVNFESDEYHVKVAKTLKEACELAEAGFDYFTTIDSVQIFRKRK